MGPGLLKNITVELDEALSGGVVSKVHQPDERTLLIKVFAKGREQCLVICTHPKFSRIHLTRETFTNPRAPKRFCAFLRSRILNARIKAVLQIEGERIVNIALEKRPSKDTEEVRTFTLVIELTGKSGNVILVDSRGHVLDALRRFSIESARAVMPGVELMPLSPLAPSAVLKEVFIEKRTDQGWNEAADIYYSALKSGDDTSMVRSSIGRVLRTAQKKVVRKLRNLNTDRARALKDEGLARLGEILVSNMDRMKRGVKEVEAVDYTTLPPSKVTVQLDERLGPQENVQRYFTKAKKAKTALKLLKARIPEVAQEIEYIDSLIYALEAAVTAEDIEELKDELAQGGYIPAAPKARGAKPGKPGIAGKAEPVRRFFSSEGFEILCGKSGPGNDLIVKKLAAREDIWFHASGVPGSHVLIKVAGRVGELTDKTIEEAAALAAWHSKARDSMKAEVAYTRAVNVKKPRGAKPGMVTLKEYKSIKVKPREMSDSRP